MEQKPSPNLFGKRRFTHKSKEDFTLAYHEEELNKALSFIT
jgi:hypothetical protein